MIKTRQLHISPRYIYIEISTLIEISSHSMMTCFSR